MMEIYLLILYTCLLFGLNLTKWYYIMISKIIFSLSGLSGVGIFLMLTQTSPNKVGPVGILALFAMIYLVFLGIIAIFLYSSHRVFLLAYFLLRKGQPSIRKQEKTPAFFLKYSAVLAFVPIGIIAKQSTGRVGIFEILLLIIIETIAILYISKR